MRTYGGNLLEWAVLGFQRRTDTPVGADHVSALSYAHKMEACVERVLVRTFVQKKFARVCGGRGGGRGHYDYAPRPPVTLPMCGRPRAARKGKISAARISTTLIHL